MNDFIYNYLSVIRDKRLWAIVGKLGLVLTIVLFAKAIIAELAPNNKLTNLAVYGIIIVVILFIPAIVSGFNIIIRYLRFRSSIYSEGLVMLKDSISFLNQYRQELSSDMNVFVNRLAKICETTKKFYDKFTNSDTSVSIKLIIREEDKDIIELVVFGLCRDKKASEIRDTKKYNDIDHTIAGNSCYHHIVSQMLCGENDSHYINPNILKDYNYTTSSIKAYSDNDDRKDLPYKSEMVLPILPLDEINNSKFEALGFFCLDSNRTNRFIGKYELMLALCIVDSVYDIISSFYDNLYRDEVTS